MRRSLSRICSRTDIEPSRWRAREGNLASSIRSPPMIVIFNPTAGRRRVAALWRVLDILAASGVRIEVTATERPGHATVLARTAAEAGVPLVVGAGGDGTIAEVAQGLAGYATQLGVIPIGTANVLARELRLPFAPRDVAAALTARRSRPIWPGVFAGSDGLRLFVQMVGVGFDANVVHSLPLALKRALGRGAYAVQTLRQLGRYPYPRIRLSIDGETVEAGNVIVSKGRLYAGTYVLAPKGDPGRTGFQIALFERSGPGATLVYGAALPTGLLAQLPGVRIMAGHDIAFLGCDGIPVQADGDAAGHTPIHITDAAAPLSVVVG